MKFADLTAKLTKFGEYKEKSHHSVIFNRLSKLNFCNRCVMRALGIKDKTMFTRLELDGISKHKDDMVHVIHAPSNHKDPNICYCPACLGLLQNASYDKFGLQAKDMLQKTGHRGLSDFMMSIRVPTSLMIRQRYLFLLMEELGIESTEENNPIEVKDVLKMTLHHYTKDIINLKHCVKSKFMIEVDSSHEETEKDLLVLNHIEKARLVIKKPKIKHGQTFIGGTSNEKIMAALNKLDLQDFVDNNLFPFSELKTPVELKCVSANHSPIYIGGRYMKLQRHISHSPWEVGGKKLAEESVEEFIAPHLHGLIKSVSHKFGSSGREDSDVLMLGDGRPFYFELKNPVIIQPSREELLQTQMAINRGAANKVSVSDLQVVSKEMVKYLNDSVTIKSKSYSTLVKITPKINLESIQLVNKMKNIAVEQKNPSRVPRRADLLRNKVIEEIRIREATDEERSCFFICGTPKIACSTAPIDPAEQNIMFLIVEMKTSSGTYVKEFVHGDEGRTTPTLYQLLGGEKADVMALDVCQIHMKWPNLE